MTINAPTMYLAGTALSSTAAGSRPVLAGVSITWGGDSHTEFDGPATLSCEVLIKRGVSFHWSTGNVLALLDDSGRTFFAGRVTSLTARKEPRIPGAQRIQINACDTLADLASYRRYSIYWSAPDAFTITAAQRRNQIAAIMPPGWGYANQNTALDWTTARPQRWWGKEVLSVIDLHLRSTLSRRHVTTTYTQAGGLSPRLTITPERSKGGPPAGTTIVRVPASNVRQDIEWEKNPGDSITDVKVTSHGLEGEAYDGASTSESNTFDIWTEVSYGVDAAAMRAMQAAYGSHQLALDVDTLGGTGNNPHISQLVNYWLETDTKWRPTVLPIADATLLSDATVRDLLDVTKRGMAYAILENLPPNLSGYGRVEAYIIGGTATWTGKKWALNLTLGRQTAATGTPIGA